MRAKLTFKMTLIWSCLALAVVQISSAKEGAAIQEGMVAPAFTLQGSDGKPHSLSDYAGKTVVLYFYPQDNTPGCTKEACCFRNLNEQFSELNAVVLGVSKDDLASHDQFIDQFELPFVLLSDPEMKTMIAYGAWGETTRRGKAMVTSIRSTTIIGPDGRVLKHWPRVTNAPKHPAEVLSLLKK